MNEILVKKFIASHKKAQAVLILDFDATDTSVHSKQEGQLSHGYYDCTGSFPRMCSAGTNC